MEVNNGTKLCTGTNLIAITIPSVNAAAAGSVPQLCMNVGLLGEIDGYGQ